MLILIIWAALAAAVVLFMAGASIVSAGNGRRVGDVAVVIACVMSFSPVEWL